MRLHLIPVGHAVPALDAHFAVHPGNAPLTTNQLRELARLVMGVIETCELLANYIRTVGGKPTSN